MEAEQLLSVWFPHSRPLYARECISAIFMTNVILEGQASPLFMIDAIASYRVNVMEGNFIYLLADGKIACGGFI